MGAPWWESNPGLLAEELDALRRAGIPFEVDEDVKRDGVLRLGLEMELDGEHIRLTAVYPDYFPYVRPEVYAPDLHLARHQNPGTGALCLIGRSSEFWEVEQTLAGHLVEQLPQLIAAARRPAGTPSPVPEQHQGEPISDYYPIQAGALLLFDSVPQVPAAAARGRLMVALDPLPTGSVSVSSAQQLDGPVVRGVLAQVQDREGRALLQTDAKLVGSVKDAVPIEGRWVRMDPPTPPRAPDDIAAFAQAILGRFPDLADTRRAPHYNGRHRLDILGILFSEEVRQDQYADGWLFLIRAFRGRSEQGVMYLAGAGRAGREDLSARIPELRQLAQKTVSVVGLGGIGAPIALELARAQIGELRILDHDRVDPGTAVRWPFGLAASGRLKTSVIEEWIRANEPYTQVVAQPWRIGGVRNEPALPSDHEVVDQFLRGSDLLIDATAEYGLHYLLSEEARNRCIPYLEVATRNGAWGGAIARIGPSQCWLCYQSLLEELRTSDQPIVPAADPAPLQQPTGCADPTFTGSGFDVAEYSLMASRLAASTLADGQGYPRIPWDIAIVNLRTPTGSPDFHAFTVEQHPSCPRRSHDAPLDRTVRPADNQS